MKRNHVMKTNQKSKIKFKSFFAASGILISTSTGCIPAQEAELQASEMPDEAEFEQIDLNRGSRGANHYNSLASSSCLSSSASVVGLSDTTINFKGNGKISGSIVLLGDSHLKAGGNASAVGAVYAPNINQVSTEGHASVGSIVAHDFTQNEPAIGSFIQNLQVAEPDQIVSSVTSSLLLVGNGGTNIVQVNRDISLSSSSVLKFRGTAQDRFIVLVKGKLAVAGQASFQLEGGIPSRNILFILTAENSSIQIAGNAKVLGTFVATHGTASLTGNGRLQGSVLAWKSINIAGNGSSIEAAPFCPADWNIAPPSPNPTPDPSTSPTASPSASPTTEPSASPTASPSASPTTEPSASPTASPSASPTTEPSASPSSSPTADPSAIPSPAPTCTGLECGILGT